MVPESIKNLIKIELIFVTISSSLFFRSWVDSGSKKLSKMSGLGVISSTSLRVCEKCDFEQPSYGFAIFYDFKRGDFQPHNGYFLDVLSKMLLRSILFDFGSKFVPNWAPNGNPNR